MKALTLSFIASALQLKGTFDDHLITGVSTDTRTLQKGFLFVALKGQHVDGHDFILEAEARGAVAVLVSQLVEARVPCLYVEDTLKALGLLAARFRAEFSIPVIALTGSCGKTTVKEMLASIISQQYPVLATLGNLNNEIGVPLTLLRLQPQHGALVVEMGARHGGDIAYLMSLARPTVSLITNAGMAHVEIFGSEAAIAKAKGEIFEALPPGGTALINEDDPHAAYWKGLLKPSHRLITFGYPEKATLRAHVLQNDLNGLAFTLLTDTGETRIQLSVLGEHNISNALAAAAGALALGLSLEVIQKGLEAFNAVEGRLQVKKGLKGATLLDDTYNANPASMRSALKVLAKAEGPKIFVIGDMLELGSDALHYHQEMGELAKELGIDSILGLGPLSAAACQRFGARGIPYLDKQALIQDLRPLLDAKTTVLLKGSRRMRLEEVIEALIEDKHLC